MANLHWFLKLVIVAFVAAIDYSQGKALIGFSLAAFYLAASLWSLIRRDRGMFKRRLTLFVMFVVEVFAIASVVETPLDLGVLERWIDKLAGHEYYKTK